MINWQTRAWMHEHYVKKGMSYAEIGKLVGRSDVRICQVAKQLGIITRTISAERGKKHKQITKNLLEDLYNDQQLTIIEISQLLNTPESVITNRLKKYNIKSRNRSESKKFRSDRDGRTPRSDWDNHDWLRHHYIDEELSIKELSALTGWSYGFVRNQLIHYNINLRTFSKASIVRRNKASNAQKNNWKNDAYRDNMSKILATRPKVSSIQESLYCLLDDLNVKYYREYNNQSDDSECKIGPWNFDCVVPTESKSLLIECQGDWYHSQKARIDTDRRKAEYINTYCSDKYELKYLWEHEFACKDRVLDTLKYWLNIHQIHQIDFTFNDIDLRTISSKQSKTFLGKYHYISNSGRVGSRSFGAFLDDELIAVLCYGPPVRQNVTIGDILSSSIREISRLCIHPKYQKKNFGSWIISRCIKKIPSKYSHIIAYADATHNHTGAVYKASNFTLDKIAKPTYWYRSHDGWIMHKKTLYDKARAMYLTESEYANKFNYNKTYGKERYRFVYQR